MPLSLAPFSEAAAAGHHLALDQNDDGEVLLYAAEQTFAGRVLTALSYIPILRNLQAVVDHCNKLQIDNAQALGVFMQALATRFGDKAAERALALNHVDYEGHTPLDARVVSRVIESAQTLSTVGNTPAPIGFHNQGNTCYANAALKMWIHAMGVDALTDHLHHVVDTSSDVQQKNAAQKFLLLLNTYAAGDMSADHELAEFFNSLNPLEGFRGDFEFNGEQRDSPEFLEKLLNVFGLDTAPGFGMGRRDIRPGHDGAGPHTQASMFQLVDAKKPELTMQDIVDNACAAPGAPDAGIPPRAAKPAFEWTTPDLSALQRFTLSLDTITQDAETRHIYRVPLTDAKFDSTISVVVHEEKSNQKWKVEFEPKEIIVLAGGLDGGHYFAYTHEGNGKWVRHDDERVAYCDGLAASDQPTLISYAVKKAVLIRTDAAAAMSPLPASATPWGAAAVAHA